jgi:hypothetical protein
MRARHAAAARAQEFADNIIFETIRPPAAR